MKKLLLILVAILMFCSCMANVQPEIEFVEGITSPPAVGISYGDVSINATKGTYSWEYDNGDGTQTTEEADSFHPTEFEEIATIVTRTEKTAKLVFDENMITYELYRWKVGKDYLYDGIGEDFEIGPEEKVYSENGVFEVPEDGNIYVYELYVKYKNGSCYYGFKILPPDDWGLTLSVKDVTSKGATLVFSQSGGNAVGELMTGSYYRLEYEDEEMAFAVEGDIAWTSEAYMIPKDGELEMQVNWEWLYGTLEPGTYRIVKQVMDHGNSGNLVKFYSVEFTVGEKKTYSVGNMKIVDGAETGNLVLAGKNASDVITLSVGDIPVYLDGELADASVIKDGMTAEIRSSGVVLEAYPATFEKVYEIHVYSIGTKNEPGGTFFDLSGLYLKVLEDLWDKDSGLNAGAEYVSIDLSEAPGGLTDGEKSAIAWIFGNKHAIMALSFTMEELKENGYLTAAGGSNDLYQWDNGVFFQIYDNSAVDPIAEENSLETYFGLPVLKFDAMKWRSPLGAYFLMDCSAVWPQMGTWSDYNIGAEAIS